MPYLLIKKNACRMIRLIDFNNIHDRSAITKLIESEDLLMFYEQCIPIFEIGFEYQCSGVYFKICATQEEAEVS